MNATSNSHGGCGYCARALCRSCPEGQPQPPDPLVARERDHSGEGGCPVIPGIAALALFVIEGAGLEAECAPDAIGFRWTGCDGGDELEGEGAAERGSHFDWGAGAPPEVPGGGTTF